MAFDDDGFIDLLRVGAARDPDSLFGRFNGEAITFGALDRQVRVARLDALDRGLGPGDRVGVMMRNSPEALAVVFGLTKAGVV